MKRWLGHLLLLPMALGTIAMLEGCPIYSDNHNHRVCQNGTCYSCDNDYYDSYSCIGWQCDTQLDCPNGYTCTSQHACVVGSSQPPTGTTSCSQPSDCPSGQTCGADDKCHNTDCSAAGCPNGYTCTLQSGKLACVSTGKSDGGPTFTGCKNDGACASKGAGAKCLNGDCVAPADQCSDATQCPTGSQCVQGACTPSCDATHPCATGYSCDTSKGVCTGNPTPCGSTGQSCSGSTVCVEDHCVTPCGAGNTCSQGLICIGGGCIPDQKPQFVCTTEGTQDACASGSTCLHHSCYIACSADAGTQACQAADKFNECKQVQTGTGTYSVCGSSSNLGTECDPTQGKNCTSPLICIDGFCR